MNNESKMLLKIFRNRSSGGRFFHESELAEMIDEACKMTRKGCVNVVYDFLCQHTKVQFLNKEWLDLREMILNAPPEVE